MLSCHKDDNSVIENGKFNGLTLKEAIEKSETSLIGASAEAFEDFPFVC